MFFNMRKLFLRSCFLLFLLGYAAGSMAQCAMCRANAESSLKEGSQTAASLNSGILYMLVAVYGIVMVVGIAIIVA
jgi:hypothetical protein